MTSGDTEFEVESVPEAVGRRVVTTRMGGPHRRLDGGVEDVHGKRQR